MKIHFSTPTYAASVGKVESNLGYKDPATAVQGVRGEGRMEVRQHRAALSRTAIDLISRQPFYD